MTKTVAYILVVALLSECAYTTRDLIHYRHYEKADKIVIHERIGDTIEREERERFGLFPGVQGFKSAMFCGIAGGGYEVRIVTESKKLLAVNRDTLAITILSDYIDRYEEIHHSMVEFQRKWKIADYDTLGLAITQYEVNRTKKSGSAMLIGGTAGCVVGSLGFLALGELVGEQANISAGVGDAIFFSGVALSTATGVWLGERFSRVNALRAIKESRKPRVVE